MNTQNYPNWLVPLEIAQELKAIGFDEPCHFQFLYYHGWEMLKKRGDEYGFITSNSCRAYVVENHNGIGKLSVPTWEQVFEWFREKGFRITLINYEDISKFSFFNMKIKGGVYYAGAFYTYEEAREALINKLIETYKTNEILLEKAKPLL
jgi:hypothetical protein